MEDNGEDAQLTYNILGIPKDALNVIVELLSEEDRSRVRLVSRLFFDLVGRSHFSLGLIMPSEMEQLVRVFGRYQKPLSLTFNKLQNLGADDMKHLLALTQLTALHTKGKILLRLPQLVSLELDENASVASSTLQYLPNLTHLRVKVIGGASETVILTNLMSLDMTYTENTMSNIERHNSWPNLACPKVTSLTIRSNTNPPKEWLAQFKPNTVTLQSLSDFSPLHYQLPSGSCQHLASLSIEGITIDNKSEVPWHQLRELSLVFTAQTMDMSALKELSKCTSLTTLNINRVFNQEMVDAIVVREMKQLRSFTMYMGSLTPLDVKNLLPQFNKDSLKTLSLTVGQHHKECLVEISQMTRLEELALHIKNANTEHTAYISSIMMPRLTSFVLRYDQHIGLDNLTSMTNLHTLKIINNSPQRSSNLNKLSLAAFKKLTDLELVNFVNVVDLRGATQLTRLEYDAPNIAGGVVELIAEELTNLKEISLRPLVTPIPWRDIAKFTALESLAIDTFEKDDAITQLQNLRRFTRLENRPLFALGCVHFDSDHLAHLTQLQYIGIQVDTRYQAASIKSKLPRLLSLQEMPCHQCAIKAYEEQKK